MTERATRDVAFCLILDIFRECQHLENRKVVVKIFEIEQVEEKLKRV
jgi:hypothetical protein